MGGVMTDEQILKLAKTCEIEHWSRQKGECWECLEDQLLKFARAIIEEHEKDREYNLGKDEYFNSWRN